MKDPLQYPWITYLWVVFWAICGGLIGLLQKYRNGEIEGRMIVAFIAELATSGFVGILTFWLCESVSLDPRVTAVFIGISGHMGSRALFLIEQYVRNRGK